jgi:Zn-dependent protease with chaperone function
MNNPISSGQVQVSVVEDPQINAGSAGRGQFIVTTGLLSKANDEHLQSVLAHEIAHDDLGHVSKAQTLGAGLNIATVLLEQFFPGSGQLTPLAGNLVIRAYGRSEEYEADRHGVVLLRKINPNGKQMMVNTLTWLQQTAGSSAGGFFATHPSSTDRIDRVRNMP